MAVTIEIEIRVIQRIVIKQPDQMAAVDTLLRPSDRRLDSPRIMPSGAHRTRLHIRETIPRVVVRPPVERPLPGRVLAAPGCAQVVPLGPGGADAAGRWWRGVGGTGGSIRLRSSLFHPSSGRRIVDRLTTKRSKGTSCWWLTLSFMSAAILYRHNRCPTRADTH
jgi:hypothetical protein